MKDIHNHILFGIDDGSESLEESIQIIKEAVQNGYTDIILTPHYRSIQDFTCDNQEKKRIFEQLTQEVERQNIPVHLYLGNEVTLDGDLMKYLKTDQILTLNESRYLLLELPFHSKFAMLHELIFRLRTAGIVPIIAHPERYEYYKDLDEFQQMIQEGALMQGNIGSLYCKYGKNVQERLEEMLKRHMIHFIGSDVHHKGQTSYHRIQETAERIEKLTGSKYIAEELVDKNIEKVIQNTVIHAYKIRVPRTKFKLFVKKDR